MADLKTAAPDLILHGGDLADGGAGGVEIVDRIRDLGWPGVLGNGEDALVRPESLESFAAQSKAPPAIWNAVREMMTWVRERLGLERLSWLTALPLEQRVDRMALVHASPGDPWRTNEGALVTLGGTLAIFGHTHLPFVREDVANSGSVGLPYDGDRRAAYFLIDDSQATIRRVAYDVDTEARRLNDSGLPHADWVIRMLRSASPQMP